jgi:hypothetical protein
MGRNGPPSGKSRAETVGGPHDGARQGRDVGGATRDPGRAPGVAPGAGVVNRDNAALVWGTFQSAAVRWPRVREEARAWPSAMRDALDTAVVLQDLVVRGDAPALAKLREAAQRAAIRARRSRALDRGRRARENLRLAVETLCASTAPQPERARAIVHRLSLWPELNDLAARRFVTPDAAAKAEGVVDRCLDAEKDGPTIITRGLIALGLPRERARIVANKRTK